MYRDQVTAAGHAFQTSKSWLFSHSQATLDSIDTHPFAAEIMSTNPMGGVPPRGKAESAGCPARA